MGVERAAAGSTRIRYQLDPGAPVRELAVPDSKIAALPAAERARFDPGDVSSRAVREVEAAAAASKARSAAERQAQVVFLKRDPSDAEVAAALESKANLAAAGAAQVATGIHPDLADAVVKLGLGYFDGCALESMHAAAHEGEAWLRARHLRRAIAHLEILAGQAEARADGEDREPF